MGRMESGFQECAEAYASATGQTLDDLKAAGIVPVRCRCRPDMDNQHCGGFYMRREWIAQGYGYSFLDNERLTSAHEGRA